MGMRMDLKGYVMAIAGLVLIARAAVLMPSAWSLNDAAEWMLTVGFAVVGVLLVLSSPAQAD